MRRDSELLIHPHWSARDQSCEMRITGGAPGQKWRGDGEARAREREREGEGEGERGECAMGSNLMAWSWKGRKWPKEKRGMVELERVNSWIWGNLGIRGI